MSKGSIKPFYNEPNFVLSMPPDRDEDFTVFSTGHAVKYSQLSIPSEYDYPAHHTDVD